MTQGAALLALAASLIALPSTALAQDTQPEAAKCVDRPLPLGGERIALIVANSDYQGGFSVLKSPAADQAVVTEGLDRAGFDTGVLCDATHKTLSEAVDAFAEAAASADSAIIYFAGHGFEWRGRNYLAPVEAPAEWDDELDGEEGLDARFLNVERLYEAVGRSANGLVFLDACRSEIGPAIEGNNAQMLGGADTIDRSALAVGFSTAPGQPAYDSAPPTYELSPFAESLGEHLAIPGLELSHMYRAIHRDVRRRTQFLSIRPQEPWLLNRLETEFYFQPPLVEIDQTVEAGEPLEVDIQQLENGDDLAVVLQLLKDRGAQGIIARADAGDPMAQYLYGYMLQFGVGVGADRDASAKWLERSARGGNPAALTALGFRTSFESGTQEEDEAGQAMVRQAAEQDFARASYFLDYFDNGTDTRFLRKAARDGDPYSAYLLADRGDPETAMALLKGLYDAEDDMAAVWLCELARVQGETTRAREACGWAALAGFQGAQSHYGRLLTDLTGDDGKAYRNSEHWRKLGRRTVYFELDRGEARGLNQKTVIADLVEELRRRPHGTITLEAHTDQLFSRNYSEGLASRMADSVRRQLESAGVVSTIETISYGSSKPVTQGFGIQPLNRRIEILVEWFDD